MAASSFRCFPFLPPELRRIVWQMTLGPAEIHVVLVEDYEIPDHYDFEDRENLATEKARLEWRVTPSACFAACQESRSMLRWFYRPPTSTEVPLPDWVDWDVDSVRCAQDCVKFLHTRSVPWCTVMKNMTMDVHSPEWVTSRLTDHLAPIYYLEHKFTALKTVTFVPEFWYGYNDEVHQDNLDLMRNLYDSYRDIHFDARVIHGDVPEEMWLTRANFAQMCEDRLRREDEWEEEDEDESETEAASNPPWHKIISRQRSE